MLLKSGYIGDVHIFNVSHVCLVAAVGFHLPSRLSSTRCSLLYKSGCPLYIAVVKHLLPGSFAGW